MATEREQNLEKFKREDHAAFVIGYTGETGKELVKELDLTKAFKRVVLIGRRETNITDKLGEGFVSQFIYINNGTLIVIRSRKSLKWMTCCYESSSQWRVCVCVNYILLCMSFSNLFIWYGNMTFVFPNNSWNKENQWLIHICHSLLLLKPVWIFFKVLKFIYMLFSFQS